MDARATDERFPAGGSAAGPAALLLDTVLAARRDPVDDEQLVGQLATRFAAVPQWARNCRTWVDSPAKVSSSRSSRTAHCPMYSDPPAMWSQISDLLVWVGSLVESGLVPPSSS